MARHYWRTIQPTRSLLHTLFSNGLNCGSVVVGDDCGGFHISAATEIGLRIYHLKSKNSHKVWPCSVHQLRAHIAAHELSALVKQHFYFRCRAGTSKEDHDHFTRSAELSHLVIRPRYAFVLRPTHCSLSALGVLSFR